jgi:hypothetical protein
MSGAGRGTNRQSPFKDSSSLVQTSSTTSVSGIERKVSVIPVSSWIESETLATANLPFALTAAYQNLSSTFLLASARRLSLYLTWVGTNDLEVLIRYGSSPHYKEDVISITDSSPIADVNLGDVVYNITPDATGTKVFVINDFNIPIDVEALGVRIDVKETGVGAAGSITAYKLVSTNLP